MVLKDDGEEKWSEKVINERIGEKRTLLNNTLRRKANSIGHILRRNCLLHDATEGQMTEMKGAGRRRTQLLDDLRNRRICWESKEEVEARKRWKRKLYQSYISSFHKYFDLLINSLINNNKKRCA